MMHGPAAPSFYNPSPVTETFATPPTTPDANSADALRRPLSSRSTRPTNLQIDHSKNEWRPDVVLESPLTADSRKVNGNKQPTSESGDHDQTNLHGQSQESDSAPLDPSNSPCFVHSHLDKGAALTDWFRNRQQTIDNSVLGVAKSLQRLTGSTRFDYTTPHSSFPNSKTGTPPHVDSEDDEDEFIGSLTKQLADTAVGVREMSKELGRARVQSNIQNVLIVTKAKDNRLIKLTRQLALYLMLKCQRGQKRGLVVYVDNQLRHSKRFDAEGIERDHPELFVPFPRRRTSSSHSLSSVSSESGHPDELHDEGQLRYWTSKMCSDRPHLFDFVITLGGDGTVLFTSWLFQRIVPPVLSFALGSLGFLTNFDFSDHQAVMDSAIDNGIRVNLRMRFTCTVFRAVVHEEGKGRKAVKKGETGEIIMKNIEKGGWEALEGGWSGGYSFGDGKCNAKDKEIMCFTTRPVETFEVLNDLVVDRGPSPYVSLLELFGDDHHMTTVQADGLTVSTPTGSTAYSLSAGGSLVHPEIPAILITPICPHTLSFRPMLLPDSMELRICVPYNSRSTAWASFDGRGRIELKQGDHIKITASRYPFPTVCADKQSTDWFHAISRTLKWNERERQKSFVVVEESAPKRKKHHRKETISNTAREIRPAAVEGTQEEEEDEDEDHSEEEDDKFDIDDSSPEAESQNTSSASDTNTQSARDLIVGSEKAEESQHLSKPRNAPGIRKASRTRTKSKSRSRSRSSRFDNGFDSPDRFSVPQPHPPTLSPRHVGFTVSVPLSPDSSGSSDTDLLHSAQHGTRDDLHVQKSPSGKSRIPRDREVELDSGKTPTSNTLHIKRGHSRNRSLEHAGPRAFAVWGHDSSDSNASDSDL